MASGLGVPSLTAEVSMLESLLNGPAGLLGPRRLTPFSPTYGEKPRSLRVGPVFSSLLSGQGFIPALSPVWPHHKMWESWERG